MNSKTADAEEAAASTAHDNQPISPLSRKERRRLASVNRVGSALTCAGCVPQMTAGVPLREARPRTDEDVPHE